jgi:hypothetical protein
VCHVRHCSNLQPVLQTIEADTRLCAIADAEMRWLAIFKIDGVSFTLPDNGDRI